MKSAGIPAPDPDRPRRAPLDPGPATPPPPPMNAALIETIALSAGLNRLPDHLRDRALPDAFWVELERTPVDRLTPEQQELLDALGITVEG